MSTRLYDNISNTVSSSQSVQKSGRSDLVVKQSSHPQSLAQFTRIYIIVASHFAITFIHLITTAKCSKIFQRLNTNGAQWASAVKYTNCISAEGQDHRPTSVLDLE